ncbi:MAG TPA: methyltransferase domain-containing protein [Pyrinomonadaceae bacterium]|nr:methyltransferase domain-containing protein [Pyrinomonadaceae bacterium]
MSESSLKARVDGISWYHEFDFGGGLVARSSAPDAEWHRTVWRFIERQLEAVDFRGKTVLDVGAWDGYWSFFAERRGAKYVLASDDVTQNWSDGRGIHLARELLGSAVEVNQHLSAYQLASLGRKFDIIMCFGVYYHLLDPFHAFAQIRHCCHGGTLLLLEGDAGKVGMRADEARYSFGDSRLPAFVPSAATLRKFLEAAYFRVQSQAWLRHGPLRESRSVVSHLRRLLDRAFVDRAFTVCTPFEGINELHPYKPPFGLCVYDERYRRGAS